MFINSSKNYVNDGFRLSDWKFRDINCDSVLRMLMFLLSGQRGPEAACRLVIVAHGTRRNPSCTPCIT
jgi:hypothetical protein